MDINGATALVTGTNRGIGRRLAAQLVERGARVYSTACQHGAIDLDGVEVLPLDISDPDAVAAAARAAGEVNLLVNNAGIGGGALGVRPGSTAAARRTGRPTERPRPRVGFRFRSAAAGGACRPVPPACAG
ncbi:SDR family NAD(P)-dependent oxidoreductase [Streptomyces sp. P9-A2]|uniref:SDR family NAD(P)-dependent oxidoreductase n=1 Tax=Streptomyces sp. P9-A2 TaxID=3072284 RepID=UPI003FCC999E